MRVQFCLFLLWIVVAIGKNIGRGLQLLDPEQEKCSYQFIHPECEQESDYEDDGSQWFSNPERWPYLVSIQLLRASGCFYHHCAGTLIAPDVVLTAAACLTSVIPGIQDRDEAHLVTSVYASRAPSCRHQGSERRSKIIYYKLNDSRIDSWSEANKEKELDQQVKQVNQHPLGLKLALLKLQVPLPQDNFPTIGGAGFSDGSLLAVGEVAGWGNVYGDNSQAAVLQQKIDSDYSEQFGVGGHPGEYEVHPLQGDYVIVVNGNDGRCKKMLEGVSGSWWPEVGMEGLLCAYANSSYTACGAEVGGPLIQTDVGGIPREEVQLDLQGVCAYIPPELCSPDFPDFHGYFLGVYLDVSLFVDWIAETLKEFETLFIEKIVDEDNAIDLSVTDKQERSCTTTGMCQCKKLWQFNGLPNNDCTNPDADSRGSWCIVQENSCKGSPAGTVTITGESWDRCTCDTSNNNNVAEIIDQYVQEFDQDFPTRILWLSPDQQAADNSTTSPESSSFQEDTETKADTDDCSLTRNGCRCLSQWQHDGQDHSLCANPDEDSQGPWCYIDVQQFTQEGIEQACSNLDGFLFNNQVVTDENGGVVAYFDYCRSDCL
eukprot:TRINITY_DN71948_c0_g2_i1.p1 TRINITY_DN71948_c0_g2~~TRINITY_DN71948_c0_g2_i1.p1  ORF type:complete len:600 (-),score=91.55 TRINITY_DN71948_c0_g2_i1:815-2614(-)